MKNYYYALTGIFVAGTIYYLYSESKIPSSVSKNEIKVPNCSDDKDCNKATRSTASTVPPKLVTKSDNDNNDYYKNNIYWNKLLERDDMHGLFKRSIELFKDSPAKDDLAAWISLGVVMDSSSEYGELMQHSLARINKDASANLKMMENVSNSLNPKDSFTRNQLINMASQMKVSDEEKVHFFGNEISRSVELKPDGTFSDDSLNITTSMIFFKNNVVDQDNNLSPEIRKKLLLRYETYFPSIIPQLKEYINK